MRRFVPLLALALTGASLSACGSSPQMTSYSEPPGPRPSTPVVTGYATPAPMRTQPMTVMNFPDIALPLPNSIDTDRTMLLGTENYWFGRISLATPMNVNETYEFFRRELPPLGWNEITSVRAANSVLSFQMDDRIATIQLTGAGNGSQVEFWVNPRGQTSVAPGTTPPLPPGVGPSHVAPSSSATAPAMRSGPVDQSTLPALR